jgi:hypothetical protein
MAESNGDKYIIGVDAPEVLLGDQMRNMMLVRFIQAQETSAEELRQLYFELEKEYDVVVQLCDELIALLKQIIND